MALWSPPVELYWTAGRRSQSNATQERRRFYFPIHNFSELASKPGRTPIVGTMDIGFTINTPCKFGLKIYFQEIGASEDNDEIKKTYIGIYCSLIRSGVHPGCLTVMGDFRPKILKANGSRFCKKQGPSTITFKLSEKKKQFGYKRFCDVENIKSKKGVLKNDRLWVEVEFIIHRCVLEPLFSSPPNSTVQNSEAESRNFKKLFKSIKRSPRRNSGLAYDLSTLYENQQLTDVILDVRGEVFKAHKCILAARSPVFLAMFNSLMMESATGLIRIEDVDPETMKVLLDYIYSGKMPKPKQWEKDLRSMLYATDKYDLQELMHYWDKSIKNKMLTKENCEEMRKLADMFRLKETTNQIKKLSIDTKSNKKSA